MADCAEEFFEEGELQSFNGLDIRDPNIIDAKPSKRRRTPFLVEFVDPSVSVVDLARAMESGANIIKIRMAFSSTEQKINLLHKMGKASRRCASTKKLPCPVAICNAIRTWVTKVRIFNDDSVTLAKDSEVVLTCDPSVMSRSSPDTIYVDYPNIGADIPIGMEITIGQGKAILRCISVKDNESIKCLVEKEGRATSLDSIHFRNLKHRTLPFLSKMDIDILKFCTRYEIDMVIIYYTGSGQAIKTIRNIISKSKFKPNIFSGICDQTGLDNLDDILKESDGIVFCREFLYYGLESQLLVRIPALQKWVAGKCQQVGKPMFITGVFENILATGDVCHAEISDVTNALMDGVHGFALRYCDDIDKTLFALHGLDQVCCQVEPLTFNKNEFWRMMREPKMPVSAAEAAALSCVGVANKLNARVIVISTISGRTSRLLHWFRPISVVIGVCTRPQAARLMFAYRNLIPLVYKAKANKYFHLVEEERVQYAAEFAVANQIMESGDTYIALERSSEGHIFCNTVRVLKVTFQKKSLVECHYSDTEEEVYDVEEKPVKRKKKKKREKKEKNVKNEEDEIIEEVTAEEEN